MLFIFYLIIVIVGFLVPVLLGIYTVYQFLAEYKGAPYVPTSAKIVNEILKEANLKKGQIFLELGSGDGRIVRSAVKNYQVKGSAVEINLILLIYSKIISKFQKLNINFKNADFFKISFKRTDVLFIFLLPKTLKKLSPKILKECKKGCLIISHGFKIEGLSKYQIKVIERKYFPTYYYKIR